MIKDLLTSNSKQSTARFAVVVNAVGGWFILAIDMAMHGLNPIAFGAWLTTNALAYAANKASTSYLVGKEKEEENAENTKPN